MEALSSTIQKILVANRGEIARRIMRTCRKMGIATVGVYSDADADMPFVAEADEAVLLGPAPSTESYLRIDKILEAAALTNADAIHPGYGFLAENAAFAQACREAGVIFIGPHAGRHSIDGFEARSQSLGRQGRCSGDSRLRRVEPRPGSPRERGDQGRVSRAAQGKRWRRRQGDEARSRQGGASRRHRLRVHARVRAPSGTARCWSRSYIDEPRHVEIQILGDSHGNLIHLNERECSIQRRHQKIIEETPSPALDAALRSEMGAAAVSCGKAIGYQNAGTVEFILAPDRRFYFLEVNTRLQVEHPVTECVTGTRSRGRTDLDRTRRGSSHFSRRGSFRRRSRRGSPLCRRPGCRFSSAKWKGSSIGTCRWQKGCASTAGSRPGSEVSIHYDPMLAKDHHLR